jgi:ubiquinone/menaquinone biosynthesis C-methylase UbiE
MLLDEERNDCYEAAIKAALQSKPDAVVLDIGTGTGRN